MRWIGLSLALTSALCIQTRGWAGGQCAPATICGSSEKCHFCGRHDHCKRMCEVVCEMKEVVKVLWIVRCEEFCTSLPRLGCESNREHGACGGCDASGCVTVEREKMPKAVAPRCGHVRCRKVLEKKEVVCKFPCYKCVPAYACEGCCDRGICVPESTVVPPVGVPAPPAPRPRP